MNKRLCLVLFPIFMCLFETSYVLADQLIINSEEQFLFAQQYMENGRYQQAVAEFERFIHFFPGDRKVPEASYLIGLCHLRGKAYESARRALENVHKTYSVMPIGAKALFLIAESYYRQGVYKEAEGYFKRVAREYPHTELKNQALYRLGWSRMQANRWQEASETFKMVDKNSPLYTHSHYLSDKSLEGVALPHKDPTAAGFMAAVIPGLGHAYCNRYKDALVAFLVNGLFIWAAFESFEEDHHVLGGILSFLELGWYSGNIYSGVSSAHKYNRKIRDDYRRSLPDNLSLNLFTGLDGQLGLVLRIDF